MRKDNLLCLRKKKHWIATTDSRHGLRVYPNLASSMTVTDINQLWVADITYIRLRYDFVFLAAILDVFSRKAIGWAFSRQLDASLLGYRPPEEFESLIQTQMASHQFA